MAAAGSESSGGQIRRPMRMNLSERKAARDATMTIVFSMATAERAPLLNATARHLRNKGFVHVFACCNPPGAMLNTTPNLFATKGMVVMLLLLFHERFRGKLPEGWRYFFVAMDSVRLGPHESFDSCIRWLSFPGMHVQAYGDWRSSERSWWGGQLIGFTRGAFKTMLSYLCAYPPQENPPETIDLWWKKMGELWNRDNGPSKYYMHPERGGPTVRLSTTLVSERDTDTGPQRTVNTCTFGGSLCPDGRDPGGGYVLRETGPFPYVEWYGAQGNKVGRQWRRNVFVPIANRMAISREAGPTHFGFWRWKPEQAQSAEVTVETPQTAVFASAGLSSTHLIWITSPWQLAAPWFASEKEQEAMATLTEEVRYLVAALDEKSNAAPVETMGAPDLPLFDGMLDAAVQLQAPVPPPQQPTIPVVFAQHVPDLEEQFNEAVDRIVAKLQSEQIKKRDRLRAQWNNVDPMEEPEIFLGALLISMYYCF